MYSLNRFRNDHRIAEWQSANSTGITFVEQLPDENAQEVIFPSLAEMSADMIVWLTQRGWTLVVPNVLDARHCSRWREVHAPLWNAIGPAVMAWAAGELSRDPAVPGVRPSSDEAGTAYAVLQQEVEGLRADRVQHLTTIGTLQAEVQALRHPAIVAVPADGDSLLVTIHGLPAQRFVPSDDMSAVQSVVNLRNDLELAQKEVAALREKLEAATTAPLPQGMPSSPIAPVVPWQDKLPPETQAASGDQISPGDGATISTSQTEPQTEPQAESSPAPGETNPGDTAPAPAAPAAAPAPATAAKGKKKKQGETNSGTYEDRDGAAYSITGQWDGKDGKRVVKSK